MSNKTDPRLCRDCFYVFKTDPKCKNCGSPRIVSHKNLLSLEIAHIDCDAFYASIEKRDDPSIRNLPVIVGGSHRGVVTTCCYIARVNGVRSAMPIFQAKKLCPNAVIISPRMDYYKKISGSIERILTTLSPKIEFVSLDEAYIDLSGTQRLHGEPPAIRLAKISKKIETEIGITISIGLSHNKFLAKIGSELEKPRGFSVIGHSDTSSTLRDKSIAKILGVGKKTELVLKSNGINIISDILKYDKEKLQEILGSFGETLWFLARGIDNRKIEPNKPAKSISYEKTFKKNEIKLEILTKFLWELAEKIAWRLKRLDVVALKVKVKLKDTNFKVVIISTTLNQPSNSPEEIFQKSKKLLQKNITKGPFRLIGLTLTGFSSAKTNVEQRGFFDESNHQTLAAENAIDHIRSKFGKDSIVKGRSLKKF